MPHRACAACSSVILGKMERGERTFTDAEITKFVYHPSCSACQSKPGPEFICRVCEMVGWKRPTEIVIRGGLSHEQFNNAVHFGLESDAAGFFGYDAGKASNAKQTNHAVGDDRQQREQRIPTTLRNRIVALLGEQTVYEPRIVQGRRRGTYERKRILSNVEIADRVGCTPEYVGKVKQWLSTDERDNEDLRLDGDGHLTDVELNAPRGQLVISPARGGYVPSIQQAKALRDRRFAPSSEDWRKQEGEYRSQLVKVIRGWRGRGDGPSR